MRSAPRKATAAIPTKLVILAIAMIGGVSQNACSAPPTDFSHICSAALINNEKQHFPHKPSAILFNFGSITGAHYSLHPDLDCMYNFCSKLYEQFYVTPLFQYSANDIPFRETSGAEPQAETNKSTLDPWPHQISFPGVYSARYLPATDCDNLAREGKMSVPRTSNGKCVTLHNINANPENHFTVTSYYKNLTARINIYYSDIFDERGKLIAQIQSPIRAIGDGPSIQTCSDGAGSSSNEFKNTLSRLLTQTGRGNGY